MIDAMSFLLLKSRRNQPPPPQAPTGFRPNRGSSNHLVPRNPVQSAPAARSFSRGGQMQQQVQIQRPKSTISNLPRQAIPRQTQRIQQGAVPKQQQQQQEKASGEVQGVISMDEGESAHVDIIVCSFLHKTSTSSVVTDLWYYFLASILRF